MNDAGDLLKLDEKDIRFEMPIFQVPPVFAESGLLPGKYDKVRLHGKLDKRVSEVTSGEGLILNNGRLQLENGDSVAFEEGDLAVLFYDESAGRWELKGKGSFETEDFTYENNNLGLAVKMKQDNDDTNKPGRPYLMVRAEAGGVFAILPKQEDKGWDGANYAVEPAEVFGVSVPGGELKIVAEKKYFEKATANEVSEVLYGREVKNNELKTRLDGVRVEIEKIIKSVNRVNQRVTEMGVLTMDEDDVIFDELGERVRVRFHLLDGGMVYMNGRGKSSKLIGEPFGSGDRIEWELKESNGDELVGDLVWSSRVELRLKEKTRIPITFKKTRALLENDEVPKRVGSGRDVPGDSLWQVEMHMAKDDVDIINALGRAVVPRE